MALTAKLQETLDVYEITEDVEITLKDGKKAIIEKSLGVFTKDQLEDEKKFRQSEIDELQKKIDAINAVK